MTWGAKDFLEWCEEQTIRYFSISLDGSKIYDFHLSSGMNLNRNQGYMYKSEFFWSNEMLWDLEIQMNLLIHSRRPNLFVGKELNKNALEYGFTRPCTIYLKLKTKRKGGAYLESVRELKNQCTVWCRDIHFTESSITPSNKVCCSFIPGHRTQKYVTSHLNPLLDKWIY